MLTKVFTVLVKRIVSNDYARAYEPLHSFKTLEELQSVLIKTKTTAPFAEPAPKKLIDGAFDGASLLCIKEMQKYISQDFIYSRHTSF